MIRRRGLASGPEGGVAVGRSACGPPGHERARRGRARLVASWSYLCSLLGATGVSPLCADKSRCPPSGYGYKRGEYGKRPTVGHERVEIFRYDRNNLGQLKKESHDIVSIGSLIAAGRLIERPSFNVTIRAGWVQLSHGDPFKRGLL